MTSSLAIFGASPRFSEPLHVGRPNVPPVERVLSLIEEALRRKLLTNNGPLVQRFEKMVAEFLGVPHCIAVSSATAGLQMAAMVLGKKTGPAVMPSFTFIGTAHAMTWCGFSPVFCDVGTDHTIDPASAAKLITPGSVLVAVDLWGLPCRDDELTEVAGKHRTPLIIDAAHSFGCFSGKRRVGYRGDAEVFSFHGTKIISCFEGGAITTSNSDIADELRRSRNFGFRGIDDVACLGTNAKMSEASAAMGIASLECYEQFCSSSSANYEIYRSVLSGIPGVTVLTHREGSNHHYLVVEIDNKIAALSRNEIQLVLRAEGILARRYFTPGCHRSEPYAKLQHMPLPTTERLCASVLCLPTGSAVAPEDAKSVAECILMALNAASTVKRQLAGMS